jgi:hypothetical protein
MKGQRIGDTLKAVKATGAQGYGPPSGLLGKLQELVAMSGHAADRLSLTEAILAGGPAGSDQEREPTEMPGSVAGLVELLAGRLASIDDHAATILQVITGELRAVRND